MAKYRKKPVVIDAMQFDGRNHDAVFEWMTQASPGAVIPAGGDDTRLIIQTLEGDMTASTGDWIIRGVKGEFYPCKPDIFAATYEPA
jgi:hypothetical protein